MKYLHCFRANTNSSGYVLVRRFFKNILLVLLCVLPPGCTTNSVTNEGQTLFTQIGGMKTIEKVVDNFIDEISFNQTIYAYFEDTNIKRFREKLIEQICLYTDGPCKYTGDSMEQVHAGMKISEAHFNQTVELLIKAMERADIPHPEQNLILQRFAPMRKDIIYL